MIKPPRDNWWIKKVDQCPVGRHFHPNEEERAGLSMSSKSGNIYSSLLKICICALYCWSRVYAKCKCLSSYLTTGTKCAIWTLLLNRISRFKNVLPLQNYYEVVPKSCFTITLALFHDAPSIPLDQLSQNVPVYRTWTFLCIPKYMEFIPN